MERDGTRWTKFQFHPKYSELLKLKFQSHPICLKIRFYFRDGSEQDFGILGWDETVRNGKEIS